MHWTGCSEPATTASWPVWALYSFFLGDDGRRWSTGACDGTVPRGPADLGLSAEQFAEAVVLAPGTGGPLHHLEHLDLDPAAVRDRVDALVESYGG
jgi:glycerol-1-phosphate dehydrogenase [NAD(P)+]